MQTACLRSEFSNSQVPGKNIDRKQKLPVVTEGLVDLRLDLWPSKPLKAERIVEFGSAGLPPSCTKISTQT